MSGDELDDVQVRDWLRRAADEVDVDVDVEWVRLVDRLEREARELEGMPAATPGVAPAAPRPAVSPRVVGLVAVAAVVVALLALAGPVLVRTSVTLVRLVQDVTEPPPTDAAPPTVVTTAPVPPSTLPPPPPPPPTTTPPPTVPTTAPAASTDLAHAPIVDGDAYRLAVRRVHNQLNAAIGFGRSDYAALEGADAIVEGLLGQRPQFDADLRDTIGHLRQAMRAQDRNAASAAHTIIEGIERALAEGR